MGVGTEQEEQVRESGDRDTKVRLRTGTPSVLHLQPAPADHVEVRPGAQEAFNADIQQQLRGAVWNAGGCHSWYLDENGVNRAVWPGFSWRYWLRTRRVRTEDYHMVPR